MTTDQQLLWEKIKNFELDEPSVTMTFTDRLARENGWSIEFSIRAVHEYKKFIFMLCIANHSLTPSDEVDQVWHLHLLYTQSYWIDFCENTIQRQVHHGPTKGGRVEAIKYEDLYQKTLQLYKSLFNESAPLDIWPPKEVRFRTVNFQRVNLDGNWIIKKPRILKR